MSGSEEERTRRLSKSRFVAGCHCHKRLWWLTHEPDAPELVADSSTQFNFDQGNEVGELARTWFSGGELIDFPHWAVNERVAATVDALGREVPAIYEASFVENDVFVAVDILERTDSGFTLVEVKATNSLKDEHVPDAAIQTHVLRTAGIDVQRTEVMHLNRECRYPDLSNLFVREDVTAQVEQILPELPEEIHAQLHALRGPLPEVEIGDHCNAHYGCPFMARCWPELPEYHVSTLSGVGEKTLPKFLDEGLKTIHDIPEEFRLNAVQARQRRAVIENRMIVEPGLGKALTQLEPPIAFLDFETVQLAVPRWVRAVAACCCAIQLSRGNLPIPTYDAPRTLLCECGSARIVEVCS